MSLLFEITKTFNDAWSISPSNKEDGMFNDPRFLNGVYFRNDGVVVFAMRDGYAKNDLWYEKLYVYPDGKAEYFAYENGDEPSAHLTFKDALNPVVKVIKGDSHWRSFDGKDLGDVDVYNF